MALVLEHAPNDNGKVTAGLPSLSPSKRQTITESNLKRIYQDSLVSEYRSNERKAAAPADGKRSMNNWDDQVGIPLSAEQIILRISKINKKLWFERSNSCHSWWGVYVLNPLSKSGKDHICYACRDGINPENTVAIVDEKGVHKALIPGWRQLLSRLIRSRLITEPAAFSVFGVPSRDSERWQLFTQ